MVVKLVYPAGKCSTPINQQFSYECKTFSVSHIYRKENSEEFEKLMDEQRTWYQPIGLASKGSPFTICPNNCIPPNTGCEQCEDVEVISLLSLDEQIPILLTRCELYVMNGEGNTIDRILC